MIVGGYYLYCGVYLPWYQYPELEENSQEYDYTEKLIGWTGTITISNRYLEGVICP